MNCAAKSRLHTSKYRTKSHCSFINNIVTISYLSRSSNSSSSSVTAMWGLSSGYRNCTNSSWLSSLFPSLSAASQRRWVCFVKEGSWGERAGVTTWPVRGCYWISAAKISREILDSSGVSLSIDDRCEHIWLIVHVNVQLFLEKPETHIRRKTVFPFSAAADSGSEIFRGTKIMRDIYRVVHQGNEPYLQKGDSWAKNKRQKHIHWINLPLSVSRVIS